MSIERFVTSAERKTTVIGNSRSLKIMRDDSWSQIANVLAANRVFTFLDFLSCVLSPRSCALVRRIRSRRALCSAADVDGAEAQDYVAAGGGAAEAEHRAETGEQEHLVELVAQVEAARTGQNLVADHLAV